MKYELYDRKKAIQQGYSKDALVKILINKKSVLKFTKGKADMFSLRKVK